MSSKSCHTIATQWLQVPWSPASKIDRVTRPHSAIHYGGGVSRSPRSGAHVTHTSTHAMKSRTTTATRAAENMRSKSTCFRVVVSACFWPSDVAQDSPPLQSAFATHSDPATNTATWRYINHFLTCWRHNYSANRPHCDEY